MTSFRFREAQVEEDPILAQHFYQLWLDNQVPPALIQSDWEAKTLTFLKYARQTLCYKAFIAEQAETIVGSTGCQVFSGLYPLILSPQQRNYGYIWGVYVKPDYRRQGVARQLMYRAITYLQSLNCTRTILHASPSGKPLYQQLGFRESNEMALDLQSPY